MRVPKLLKLAAIVNAPPSVELMSPATFGFGTGEVGFSGPISAGFGLRLMFLGFIAALLGGLGSARGAIIGGLLVCSIEDQADDDNRVGEA